MKKLNILVCENYLREFQAIAEDEKARDVRLVSFPSLCSRGPSSKSSSISETPETSLTANTVLICSKFCKSPRKNVYGKDWFRVYESTFCYSHLINDQISRFFFEEGYYVITTGWLLRWKANLEDQGFSRETARQFYGEWCQKIIFLDTDISKSSKKDLEDLSEYLQIPSKIIPVSLEPMRAFFRKILSEWRIKNHVPRSEGESQILELQQQNAHNAAVLNIMSRIAVAGYKRDVISMLKEVWLTVFGATQFFYWARNLDSTELPDDIKKIQLSMKNNFYMDKKSNTFYALLESGGKEFGIIQVGEFLFPHSISKYMELFDSIIKVASLAFSNAHRYEELTMSRNQHEYNSFHDGLTGVYNRNFYNKLIREQSHIHPGAIFSFDVNGLKVINDTQGHAAGDKIIRKTADTLRKTFRETDFIIRMGGDEFLTIVLDCNQVLADAILQRLEENTKKVNMNSRLKLSISIGLIVTTNNDDDLESLVHQADFKMYQDKRKTKGASPQ
ncbi:MAG: diguanylate cyclase [Desulfobacterium sp.]|nr:diguanylate cyclase [Desulfobacterium sp.]